MWHFKKYIISKFAQLKFIYTFVLRASQMEVQAIASLTGGSLIVRLFGCFFYGSTTLTASFALNEKRKQNIMQKILAS